MTAPMVDYKIHWLKMMSVPESRAVVGRHDGINGRDNRAHRNLPRCFAPRNASATRSSAGIDIDRRDTMRQTAGP